MSKIVFSLALCCMAFPLPASDTAFWSSAEDGRALIPQPAARPFISAPAVDALESFEEYTGRSPPKVPPRQAHLTFYPCSQCHDHWETNPEPRRLAPVHQVGLRHGDGHLWCLDCHAANERDQLRTLQDTKVNYNEAWRICGQCHANRQRDWYFGAHGKRVYDWQGKAERYNCTHCHNPHRPRYVKRKPQAKPPVRAGLQPVRRQAEKRLSFWEEKRVHAKEEQQSE